MGSKFGVTVILFILTCISVSIVDAQWQTDPLTNFNGTITFEDLQQIPAEGTNVVQHFASGFATLTPSINFQQVQFSEDPGCYIAYCRDSRYIQWVSTQAWTTIPDEMPGFFARSIAPCSVSFRNPINAISMRINSRSAASLVLFDLKNTTISTTNIPIIDGNNTFAYLGYSSLTQISGFTILSNQSEVVIDNIQWLQCAINQRFNGNTCEGKSLVRIQFHDDLSKLYLINYFFFEHRSMRNSDM